MSRSRDGRKQQSLIAMNGILALLMILVLILPIASAYYSDYHKRAVIFSATDSDLQAVDWIFTDPISVAEQGVLETSFGGTPTVVFDEDDNQSYIFKTTQEEIAYFDAVTNVGNDSVVAGLNYSKLTAGAGTLHLGFQLDISSHNLTQYDFIELVSNDDHTGVRFLEIAEGTGFWSFPFTETANNTYICPLDLTIKTTILSVTDRPVYLTYNGIDTDDTGWTFSTGFYELSNTIWSWDDFQLYAMAIMGSVVIMIVAIAFNTDAFDILIDKNRKDKR